MPAPTTLLMPQRHVGGALSYLSGMGVDDAHNTVGEMSAPTTLLGFCHARKVAGYRPTGAQGTVLGITVDLSALPYFLRPFLGPYRAGVPGRLVPVGSDCASWRGAVSRGSAHSRSEKWVRVRSGVLVRPSGRRGRPKVGRSWIEAFQSERRRRSSSARPSSRRPGSPF